MRCKQIYTDLEETFFKTLKISLFPKRTHKHHLKNVFPFFFFVFEEASYVISPSPEKLMTFMFISIFSMKYKHFQQTHTRQVLKAK